jgi:protein-S-isoprenylcysteine O-methyltransferase Ste14
MDYIRPWACSILLSVSKNSVVQTTSFPSSIASPFYLPYILSFQPTQSNGNMASEKKTQPPLAPMDFFPFRGQYGGSVVGAALFVAVRGAVPLIFYSLFAPPTSRLSIFSILPNWAPSQPPPTGNGLSIPGLPNTVMHAVEQTLGLSRIPSLIFLGALLPSFSFIMYNTIWRREKFPLLGQGGSIQVTANVNLIDTMHAVLFVYLASRNPTWDPSLFRWMPLVFTLGLGLHIFADHSKYLFRKDERNRGKVYTGGVWGVVRHPNFLGFYIWRVAFGTAAGGWAFGAFFVLMFGFIFYGTAVPVLEGYMARTYKKQWDVATEKVRWKLIPGIW